MFTLFCLLSFDLLASIRGFGMGVKQISSLNKEYSQTSVIEDISTYMTNVTNLTLLHLNEASHIYKITPRCNASLTYTFTHFKPLYLKKLIYDSSKYINDISSYKDCYYNYYSFTNRTDINFIKNNITYVIFAFSNKEVKHSQDGFNITKRSIIGLCLPDGCSNRDYEILFSTASMVITNSDIDDNETREHLFPDWLAYSMSSFDKHPDYKSTIKFIACFTPSLIFLFVLFISFLPNFFGSFSCFGWNPIIVHMKRCFNLGENCEEILKNKISIHDSAIYNESGVSMLKGLRAIAIIMVIIGTVFEIIFLSPMTSNNKYLIYIFTQPEFSFIIFCQRFGKRFCYFLSGITLIYKQISYLDAEVEYIDEYWNKNHQTSTSRASSNNTYKWFVATSCVITYSKAYYKYHHFITIKTYLFFIYRWMYKYVLLWGFALFYKYNLYLLVNLLIFPGPFWIYFSKEILSQFTLLSMFGAEFIQITNYKLFYSKSNPFHILITEINNFIVWSFIIYLSYKKNYRWDIIIIWVLLFLLTGKFIWYNYYFTDSIRLAPAKSFMFSINNIMWNSTLYNMTYFTIGIFFGLINYSIQKSNLKYSKKTFIKIPLIIVTFLQKKKHRIIFNISLLSLVFIVFSYYFWFKFLDTSTESFLSNYYVNWFYLYDNEIAWVAISFLVFHYFFDFDNIVVTTLKHQYWNCLARPYFSLMLLNCISCYYIMYQNDTKIRLDGNNVFFYSILGICVVLFSGIITFILLEVPFKKLNKVIIGYFRKNEIKNRLETIPRMQSTLSEMSAKSNKNESNSITDNENNEECRYHKANGDYLGTMDIHENELYMEGYKIMINEMGFK